MLNVRWILITLATTALCGQNFPQGTTPKHDASEYPVQARAGEVAIGAEFMIHSFSRGEATYFAPDYLVVEIAFFPPKDATLALDLANFSLRINDRKPIPAESPSLVAAYIEHPEWRDLPQARGSVGMGDKTVIFGPPPVQQPFPVPNAPPLPPRIPHGDPNVPAADRDRPGELVVETALPPGEHRGPVSGYLYFAYKGKVKSIRSVDLLYRDLAIRLK